MASKTKKWKLKTDSISKLIIYFHDGGSRTFYSRDWKHAGAPNTDRSLGLKRLFNLADKYRLQTKAAIIYDLKNDKQIARHTEKEGMTLIN
ncbi:MAG: hypothetical protein WBA74_23500 [Cyclobacteriaceae bacterium]